VREAYAINGFTAIVMSFCSEMELAYSAADIVVARSGAATLTELAAFGLPAIVVPYLEATGNHQFHNARVFEQAGAARIVEPGQLAAALVDLLADSRACAAMAAAARSRAVEDAATRIADLVEAYAN
jgi:UDP-N-acetylglucosamine--N-acetylmuramyl-(pentapeptide) pyrophosphoryl-undecaprenol N-acetylglucosamine transferase